MLAVFESSEKSCHLFAIHWVAHIVMLKVLTCVHEKCDSGIFQFVFDKVPHTFTDVFPLSWRLFL